MTAHLPDIAHPRSRMGNPDALGVRGISRAGSRTSAVAVDLARDMGQGSGGVAAFRSPRKSAGHSEQASFRSSSGALKVAPVIRSPQLEVIPDGVEVVNGDPMTTRLPVFGNRAGMLSRASEGYNSQAACSVVTSRNSYTSSQLRLDTDELEMVLREKMKGGFAELKKKFRDNDPEQKGNVSRDALQRILVTLINRPISSSQYKRLLIRLGLQEKNVISIGDFYASTRESPSDEHPAWMDPVDRCKTDRSLMTASQVHAHLKQRAKQKILDVMDMMPRSDPSGAIYILKPELRSVLNRMGFTMSDAEFDKLWNKYDSDGNGTTCGEKIMKKLGIAITEMQDDKFQNNNNNNNADTCLDKPQTTLRRKEKDRQRSLDIELWLKNKFREGCTMMKKAFEGFDKGETGLVLHNDFLTVLDSAELHLQKEHLAEFMARCGVQPTQTEIPYLEFLHRFQDRSEHGMPHKIMVNNKHRYNRARSMTMSTKTTFSALETQLMNIFQTDFLTLLGTFHKIDRLGLDILSQEEFRAAIESKFGVEMTDGQFRAMLDGVPLDDDGNVKYSEFMAQFDTKGQAESLYEKPKLKKTKRQKIPTLPENECDSPAPMTPVPMIQPDTDSYYDEDVDQPREPSQIKDVDDRCMVEIRPRRNTGDLFHLIRSQLRKDFRSLEEAFLDIDMLNTGRMSQEMLYKLMKRFPIDPPINRGEIRDLWKTFIVNIDKTLNFQQFLRHFGYAQSSFPSAKVSPPERGDKDCMIRSRKLNCARDMIHDSLRSKIDYMWTDLRRQFTSMDKYLTGCISSEEFREVLQQLCIHLSDYELSTLTKKFTTKDGRISYFEFLKPFAVKKQIWRYGNDMLDLLKHGLAPDAVLPDQQRDDEAARANALVISRLKAKLSGEWKVMRRAFKKLDTTNRGVIPLTQFKNVLKSLSGVSLSEDDVYELMSRFDRRMTGEIAYLAFLAETFSVQPAALSSPVPMMSPIPAAGAVTYRPPGGGVAGAMRNIPLVRASAEV